MHSAPNRSPICEPPSVVPQVRASLTTSAPHHSYVAGNEVADHTMTHVGSPNSSEILGNLAALNAFSGIPLASLTGFRAPMLNFTADTLKHLHDGEFEYDSSVSAATPADQDGTDAFWPYTMDNGESPRNFSDGVGCWAWSRS